MQATKAESRSDGVGAVGSGEEAGSRGRYGSRMRSRPCGSRRGTDPPTWCTRGPTEHVAMLVQCLQLREFTGTFTWESTRRWQCHGIQKRRRVRWTRFGRGQTSDRDGVKSPCGELCWRTSKLGNIGRRHDRFCGTRTAQKVQQKAEAKAGSAAKKCSAAGTVVTGGDGGRNARDESQSGAEKPSSRVRGRCKVK